MKKYETEDGFVVFCSEDGMNCLILCENLTLEKRAKNEVKLLEKIREHFDINASLNRNGVIQFKALLRRNELEYYLNRIL